MVWWTDLQRIIEILNLRAITSASLIFLSYAGRMLANGIPLPESFQLHGAKPWEINMVDTLQWWKFGDYKNYISLNLLANVLGVPTSKTDIDGSMVQDVYYKEGNLKRIVEYCQSDVVVVAQILRRFKGMPVVPDKCIFMPEL